MLTKCATTGCSTLVFGSGHCLECEKELGVRPAARRRVKQLA